MSRRRALTATGAGVAGLLGAALIGCSTGKGPSSSAPGGQVSTAAPTVANKPKPGGILKYAIQKDPDSIDPYRSGGTLSAPLHANVYSGLFSFEPGDGAPASGKVIGDLAQTWEQPDPLTLVVHLNPAAKFDQAAPLNGRQVNAQDVVQSWKRLVESPQLGPLLANSRNPDAPFESFEAVDNMTVRIRLKFPDATALPLLPANVWVQPVEGLSGKIDLSKEMRGSGPFLLEKYQPSVGLTFKKNPAWFGGPERPYVDGISTPIIPDQSQMEAQFRAKNLHWAAVSNENITIFAKELPGTEIAVGSPNTRSGSFALSYAPGQPWNDVRVRRAVSMAMDRDSWAGVLFNAPKFEALGVKLNVRWNAPISGGYGAYWLDPKGAKFGPAAAYLKYNTDEATKMLAAAGYTAAKPLDFDIVFPGTYYGLEYPTRAEAWQSILKKSGIKTNLVSVDYATEYVPKYARSKGLFKGKTTDAAVHLLSGGAQADALLYYASLLGAGGAFSMTGDKFPEMDAMTRKQRSVTNFDERVAGVHDLNRWAVDNMVCIPAGPATEFVDLVWKGLRGPQQYTPWAPTITFGVAANTPLFPRYWFQDPI